MREKEYLKKRYAAILSSTGMILLISSMVMLTPLLVLIQNPEESKNALSFCLPSLCLALLGGILWRLFKSESNTTLSVQEGGIIVLVSWLTVILFSAWPFISVMGLPFSRAIFESVSGWTTAGLSVVDVTAAGQMILLWRSIIQLAGGAGLAIIMMSAVVGPTGVGISSAEGRSDQLVPHVRQSARLVLIIYSAYAMAGFLAYFAAGMSPFDAVNHAFAAVSTGGFSTKPDSIGYWNSITVEAVTLPLMLLGNLSFVTAWFVWRGKFYFVFKNGEVRMQSLLMPLSAALLFIFTCQSIYPHIGKAMRVALFETISALTTTGFSTVSYGNWNSFGVFLLISLMLIGGGTCSTAGGIKQFRIYILFKLLFLDIKRHLIPRTAVTELPIWEGNRRVFLDDAKFRQIAVFVFLYIASYGLGVMILCSYGYNLSDSLFEFASALGTVGLSVGVTSAGMPDGALWAEIFAMFLGRLEFMVIIISFLKIYKDITPSGGFSLG
ncbi:Cation transporter [Desulfamplus magnetovallimortis]|uniref:Cation transporter n=1 Tax=Desulfamplus magnetovallimortis TaxID=1246637 RepID=A0A1W1HJN0_9BACT|nr:TrkH family potassium uptake protein [Desulfamplus magnetovallimortis]SLM32615.1 Cation transporter [Desulfamplus magnetovallimortis]